MNRKVKPLPMEIIREALELDSTSPTWLRWRVRPRHHFRSSRTWNAWNAKVSGLPAGAEHIVCGKKYFRVRLNKSGYAAHRIVYAIVHNVDPGMMWVDHIDTNGQNNVPANLRLATHSENLKNRGKNRNNTSGQKGVSFCKARKKWRVKVNGKYLGLFSSINDASVIYKATAKQIHGEFFHQPQTTTT